MQVFRELSREPNCEYTGELIKHVAFIAGSGSHTAFLTASEVLDNNMLKINIYFNCKRLRGVYINKSALMKFILSDILNGVADEKNLLALPCGEK